MIIGLTVLRTVLSGFLVMVGADAPPPLPVAAPESAPLAQAAGDIDFGDDAGDWAHDGECDDKRFAGPGMTSTVLLDSDIGHDASDCRAAWQEGRLELFQPVTGDLVIDGISFGDDSGEWHNDNQCDDPRFMGRDMAGTLLAEDERRDASDCAAAWRRGTITLLDGTESGPDGADIVEDGVNFGSDSGDWTGDGECDDPRFTGAGMAGPPLLDSDIRADASDCLAAWRDGTISLVDAGGDAPASGARSIENRSGPRQ